MLVINDEYTVNYLRQQELQEQDFYVGILIYTAIFVFLVFRTFRPFSPFRTFTLLVFKPFMTYIKKYTDLK